MSRRTTGTLLLLIAAFLYGIRYLSAAIFASNVSSWDYDLFHSMLDYVGTAPRNLSIIALVGGIFYLLWAEYESRDVKTKEAIKQFMIGGTSDD
ncbi:hypothetical protein J2W91_005510 [Paenibacillus amylolyticus]|uniref:Uncharacterized protein n=1 Tax=Paenibacillus amylolyticus TaxID=1451 RepID=A0AAP5H859_PAEAM|nr:hypothetical protein [Paenibacillus amylolyticus]MDR6726985.1 hypothetical protein [Paenibacillus amylolyticus]